MCILARAPGGQMRGAATQAMLVCIVEERQQSRCPPAAAPLRAAARRPAGCVARSLHTAPGMLVARALPAGLGASSKMYTLFPDGPLGNPYEHARCVRSPRKALFLSLPSSILSPEETC